VLSLISKGVDLLEIVSIAAPCMILLLFFWYLYMRRVDKQYFRWVCNSIGRYLSAEMEVFWEKELLNARFDDKFRRLDDYMDKEYGRLISDVCGRIMEKSEEEYRQERLRELCSQWETIRREG